MVDTRLIFVLVTCFTLSSSASLSEGAPQVISDVVAEITGADLIQQSANVIKPCQSVTFVIDVTLCQPEPRKRWREVLMNASRLVQISGKRYVNPLMDAGPANYACAFELLWPDSVATRVSQHALVMASCQIDLKNTTCLFDRPGGYVVQFFFGRQVVGTAIRVDRATRDEETVLSALAAKKVLLFLLEPTDRRNASPENIAILEDLLEEPSAYSDMLSLTLGLAKAPSIGSPMRSQMTPTQQEELRRERYRLLAPVQDMELNTRLTARAAFQFAEIAQQLSRSEPERREEHLAARLQVLRKLVDCPLVPRQQSFSKAMLADLERNRQ